MTYFAFVSQYFQDQSINIVGFDICCPLLYVVTGHIMCPVRVCYIIQHLRHVDNEKVGSFNVEPHHVCLRRLLDATFFHSFPPVTCYSSYVARGDILLLCAANSGQKGIAVRSEEHTSALQSHL